MAKLSGALKRVFVGRPMSTGELEHTLLPKFLALPVFSSDPLSSVAYATQEVLLVLGLAGAAALTNVMPISFGVAALLAIVVASYRQTVRAYPSGGGAYRVAHENLGVLPGLTAGSALLLDYVMTVAVSITAGVEAIASANPDLHDMRVPLAVGFIGFVTLANLRGVRESGLLFAIPTYGFVLSIYLLLTTGFVKCLGGCPLAETSHLELHTETTLSFFLILKAFAAGTTALTGVEAISDGVPAFRYPQSRNAATTLAIMGAFSITMFLGISLLANLTQVRYIEHYPRSVVAQIAHAVFGGGPLFYLLQFMTAAILILAANTAYQDFPRLSSILAQDGYMPRQFRNRGDRLVFSNGVLVLAIVASLLVIVFDANLTRLIQLYLVGVFVSFTLSQSGMFLRWKRLRTPGWRRNAAINGFGAMVTGVVLCVVVWTKFQGGAWLVVVAIPILIVLMRGVAEHYKHLDAQLIEDARRPLDRRPGDHHMVIYVPRMDTAAARAVGYVRSVRPRSVTAITTDATIEATWARMAPEIPLQMLASGFKVRQVRNYVRAMRARLPQQDFLTVVVPEILKRRGLLEIIRRPALHRLKASFLREANIQVLDIPVLRSDLQSRGDQSHEPSRNYVCVLVTRTHNATLQAIEYAETLRPTDLRAVHISLDPEESERLGDEWLDAQIPYPLEIEDSPFRDIGISLIHYLRQFDADGVDRIVTVLIPEFVVRRTIHQILHGQTALLVKRRLLFERGIVVASVPYVLDR